MRLIKPFIISLAVIAVILAALFAVYGDKTEPPRFSKGDFAGQDLKAAIQKIADATVQGGAPGVIIHVRRNGESETVAAGFAQKAAKRKMPADAALRIASISKIYTAIIIHRLIAEGRFGLETPIRDLLPADILRDIANADQATVRQLLNHTSGIPDYYDIRSYLFTDWRKPITLERMAPTIRRRAASNEPGVRYEYSNAGYLLLGEIAEAVSGESMATLIENIIITPLGLEATYYSKFAPEGETIHGYGTYLRPWKDTYEYFEHSGPDGGVMARASEVALFLDALLTEKGALYDIGQRMTGEMIERAARRRQGLGVETIIARSGEEIFGHTGDVFGYQTIAHVYPKRDIVVVAHVNCNCGQLTSSLIANLYRAVEAVDGEFEG